MSSGGRLERRVDWYRRTFWIGFTIYVWLIFSSTIAILHNHPVNEIAPVGGNDPTLRSFDPNGTRFDSATRMLHERLGSNESGFGITYGVPYEPLWSQVDWILLGGMPSTIPWGIVFTVVLLGLYVSIRRREGTAPSMGVLLWSTVSICLLYLVFTLVAFDVIPLVNFYRATGETAGVLESLLGREIGLTFYLVVVSEGVFFAGITNLWLQPFVPDRISKKVRRDTISEEDVDRVNMYLAKWSQYGSWLVAVFGGAILSMAVLYVTEVRLFGGLVIRHIILLFGGTLVFYISFVACKIDVIEGLVVR